MEGGSGFHRVSAACWMQMWIGLLAVISAIFRFFHSISGFVLALIEQGQTTTTTMRLECLQPYRVDAPTVRVKASTVDLRFSTVKGGFHGPSSGLARGCRGETQERPPPQMGYHQEGEHAWNEFERLVEDRFEDHPGPSTGPSSSPQRHDPF